MISVFRQLVLSAAGLALIAALGGSLLDSDWPESAPMSGVAAAMHFVDDSGTVRRPSAAERRFLSEAFAEDLVTLTGMAGSQGAAVGLQEGAISTVLGASTLSFLTATEDEDGRLRIEHPDGDLIESTDSLPLR